MSEIPALPPMSEDQSMVTDAVREFVRDAVLPVARDLDRDGAFPADLLREMGGMGLFGLMAPETAGGAAMGFPTLLVVLDALAAGSASLAAILAAHAVLVGMPLFRSADAGDAGGLPAELASGRALGGGSFSALAGPAVRATPREGGFVLDGDQPLTVGAIRADWIAVPAVVEGSPPILALVPRGAPGLSVEPCTGALGLRSAGLGDVRLRGVEAPSGRVFGDGAVDSLVPPALAALAAVGAGLQDAAITAASEYGSERQQFGRPILAFEGLRARVADMAVRLSATRHMVAAAGCVLGDTGSGNGEAGAAFAARAARLVSARSAVTAADEALQIHGGYGFSREFVPERLLRDAQFVLLAAGGPDADREILARITLGEP